jgi:hypothetical protein
MPDKDPLQAPSFVLYTSPSGDIKVDVVLQDETIWMTQKAMGDLFGVESHTVTYHLKEIYGSGELSDQATTRKLRVVRQEGQREVNRSLDFYNLDAIISVGYRVNSFEATQFRMWATRTLKEYIVKGFVLDDARLKQGSRVFSKDYFDELLERIREIRASERRFYQKITDIYALAVDYDKSAPMTKEFFATVQNKLHWAITGKTSAEIIYQAADAGKPHMGLMTFKNAPDGKVLKTDVAVAKNYLSERHIRELERIVSAYLDLAENRAERQILMKMIDWVTFLNGFLELSNYPILHDAGKVSAEMARLKAEKEYEKFRVRQDQDYVSDFDKAVKALTKPGKKSGA